MFSIVNLGSSSRTTRNPLSVAILCALGLLAAATQASATENGSSVYPAGIETILTALQPRARQTAGYEFTNFYVANQAVDGHGNPIGQEFHLRVFVTAAKLAHNWGWRVPGGEVESEIAIPVIYEQLHIAPGKFTRYNVSNLGLIPVSIAGSHGDWHWYYEADFFPPGGGYNPKIPLNIGQHNYAAGPSAAFTYIPHRMAQEVSSRFAYIFNGHDKINHYHSGNEFVWEFNADQSLANKHLWLGLNSAFYQQTTDDKLQGVVYLNGNRGRDLQIGGQARFPLGKEGGFSFKYYRDTLVENRSRGNAFWFQMSFPIRFSRS